MKKMCKIISICAIMFVIIFICTNIFAANLIIETVDTKMDLEGSASTMENMGNVVLGFILAIGSVVSVAMLVIIGIKYMLGSAEEKAEYKKTMVPYLTGAILLFGATSLAKIIYDWAGTL